MKKKSTEKEREEKRREEGERKKSKIQEKKREYRERMHSFTISSRLRPRRSMTSTLYPPSSPYQCKYGIPIPPCIARYIRASYSKLPFLLVSS